MSVQIIVDSTVDMPERIKKHFRIVPLDKNETRTDKTSLEKEHRKLEEASFLSNSVR